MKQTNASVGSISFVLAATLYTSLLSVSVAAAPAVKAFPTAEGFGANARGGRGGRVIEVTNLDDSGPGSLRSAMEASGARIVVFRVSGTITLKDAIRMRTPYLTVAGQTSPGGVQIRGHGQPEGDWGVWFVNGAHDIVVRHLRVRMGGNLKHDAGNNLLCYGTAEPGVHDVIFDHCSVSWGSDTQLDWYGSYLDRATFQWNLIGECYMGQHVGGSRAPKNITLHHNLYANLGSRTPLMQHAAVFDFANNVIYNWSGNNASVFGQFALNTSAFGNVVSNLWLAGPESGYPYLNVGNGGPTRIDGKAAEAGGTKLYLAGNWGPRSPTGSTNDWTGHGVNTWDYYEFKRDGSTHLVNQVQYDAAKPFPSPPITLDPVSSLLDKVLPTVGASKPSRDAVDQRITKSVRDKTGSSRVSTTGPWPDLATGAPAAPVDSDHDGMPDAWEKAHGLDPNNSADGAAVAANGYTNAENYLNELAGDPIPGWGRASAALARPVHVQDNLPYTTYTNFNQVLEGTNARYPAVTRVSNPGTSGQPIYTGFFFYQCLQFDTTGRYLLGMRVHFEYRDIQPTDRGDIGFIDLKDGYKWTTIGETTAWSWQQGPRLQWRPASDEILWNDRSDDGKSFVCRVYDFRTGKRRTLPRPIYDLSPDGGTTLTHDFQRMHSGTDYVGIEDKYKGQHAPGETGVWKMNMDTGKAELIMPLDKMAAIAYPRGIPSSGHLYIFREGWNPSGTRFITFIKDPKNNLFEGYSIAANGTDVRYLYHNPSHHAWLDDNYIFDFGYHKPPGGGEALRGYFLFKDDGTGTAKELLWPVKVDDGYGGDGHGSFVPGTGNDWIISDTYSIHGFQYLFMYHRPSKKFVPLAKLKCNRRMDIGDGAHRVDLHPRLSRNGRLVSIDASHEGLGRQMYVIDISHIVDHPPRRL